jgi:hypothetical protein
MWNAGKNVTEKALKKKGSSARLFKTDSFFNFFNPPELRMDESDENDVIEVKESILFFQNLNTTKIISMCFFLSYKTGILGK